MAVYVCVGQTRVDTCVGQTRVDTSDSIKDKTLIYLRLLASMNNFIIILFRFLIH